ncbi:DUF2391 family protein [Candidatus Woesearchaeota archaeon]|nr:DUF2391 family protein [Candidatus Woesearchaeota archaeon]
MGIKRILKKEEKTFSRILEPIIEEFKLRDIVQVIIGASILSIPVGFTEETWRLGKQLPMLNILMLMLISFVFLATFLAYHHYHVHIQEFWYDYALRLIATYVISFIVVAVLLSTINVTNWLTDFVLAFKTTIIVTFPACMSAAVADTLK